MDKTPRLLELINSGRKDNVFRGLAAEQCVTRQSEKPLPVLRFDMSTIDTSSLEEIRQSLKDMINRLAEEFNLTMRCRTLSGIFIYLMQQLQKQRGQVVVLIDTNMISLYLIISPT